MWFVIVDLWIQAVWSLNSTVFFRQLPGCLMIWICNSNINSVSEQTAAFQFHWILWIQASNAKIHSANQCSSSPKHIQQKSESPQFFHVHLRVILTYNISNAVALHQHITRVLTAKARNGFAEVSNFIRPGMCHWVPVPVIRRSNDCFFS